MSRIVSSSLGTAVWRAGLADPYLHWRRKKSAWELAVSWESRRDSASGIPPEVEAALDEHPAFRKPALLVGVVEHRVMLDTQKTPSQNDLWCMIATDTGHASVAVEGKAGEDFDKRLHDWFGSEKESVGKERRLKFLCEVLGITTPPALTLRYQLFHRAASAVLEARRWQVRKAMMLVQSFSESSTSWKDFADFAELVGLSVSRNVVCGPVSTGGIELYLCWIDSAKASDEMAASAV